MRRKMQALVCGVLVLSLLLLPVRAGQGPVKVLISGPEPAARILGQDGSALQDLVFDRRGQAVAGPLAPGVYGVRSGDLEAQFTLRSNGALSQVAGDGWTDGEILHLGTVTTGRLTIRYDGDWQWVLAGEGADRAQPSLSEDEVSRLCTFSGLPLGAYALEGEEETLPLLLTEAEPERLVDLRKISDPNVGPLG